MFLKNKTRARIYPSFTKQKRMIRFISSPRRFCPSSRISGVQMLCYELGDEVVLGTFSHSEQSSEKHSKIQTKNLKQKKTKKKHLIIFSISFYFAFPDLDYFSTCRNHNNQNSKWFIIGVPEIRKNLLKKASQCLDG